MLDLPTEQLARRPLLSLLLPQMPLRFNEYDRSGGQKSIPASFPAMCQRPGLVAQSKLETVHVSEKLSDFTDSPLSWGLLWPGVRSGGGQQLLR